MSILQVLNTNELAARWATIPQSIKGVLSSADIKAKVEEIGTSAGVPADKIPELQTIVATVFLGLLDIDLVWDESQERFGITKEQAYTLTDRLYDEIFSASMKEIESIYAPLVSTNESSPNSSVPAPLRNASGPTLNLRPQPAPMPVTAGGGQMGGGMVQKPAAIPSMPQSQVPSSPLAAHAPAAPATPAPFILQKNTVAETVVKDSGFRLNLDPKMFGGGPSRPAVPPPPKPARLELGATPYKPAAPVGNSITNTSLTGQTHLAPKVVHYTAPENPGGIKAAPLPPKAPVPIAPSKEATTLDLRPKTPQTEAKPPAGLPIADTHPATLDLAPKKEDKVHTV